MSEIEYYTEINPTNVITSKVIQNQYSMEYKVAEHIFYNELYVPKEVVSKHLENNVSYDLIIDFSEGNDEIKTNTNYGVKFLKSVFLLDKQREVVNAVKEYYSDYIITGPFLNFDGIKNTVVFIISKQLTT